MPLMLSATEIQAVEGHKVRFSVVRVGDASQLELAWLCTEDLPKYRLYAAKQGVDYDRLEKLISFKAGVRQQDFTIQIHNNQHLDLERHFHVLLIDIQGVACPIQGINQNTNRYDRGDAKGTILTVKIIDTG